MLRTVELSKMILEKGKARRMFFEIEKSRRQEEKERSKHSQHSEPWMTPMLLETDLRILEALRCTGSVTRSELVKLCQLPRTTVYDSLVRLYLRGFVERYIEERKKRGRPKVFYLLTVSHSS